MEKKDENIKIIELGLSEHMNPPGSAHESGHLLSGSAYKYMHKSKSYPIGIVLYSWWSRQQQYTIIILMDEVYSLMREMLSALPVIPECYP